MNVILKNEEDWENFWRKYRTYTFSFENPKSYPCIVEAFEYDGASQSDTRFFFVYLEDAINLIHTYNKQKYQDLKEESD